MKSWMKTMLAIISASTIGSVFAVGAAILITQALPVAEALGEECAQLETLYGHSTSDPIPGLHDVQTSEELDELTRYLNLCWRSDERFDRINVAQDRQKILESRQLRVAIAEGRLQ